MGRGSLIGGSVIRRRGRAIKEGRAIGKALCSTMAISFFGGVDPDTGVVVEKGHDLEGKCMRGTVLVFPGGKGSTVGSYIIYRMKKVGTAPVGLVMRECDSVIATGAVLAQIPCVDSVDIEGIEDADEIEIEGEEIVVRKGG